ncbi:GNAT family N-acetyltransferase [Cellulomonas humilata]|uniref:Ribosomal protein S18 acetylase RimI-like enzyme n=1 Tax=Cellulomonas humilata TaxID=144055 RepID=A0ABU0EF67_9CELL|nr:GNAT family N-acetyltransferase [Cellulomonas humilata]MDQ0373884.1 ribosomal protein S18 acetylase RimI-like enzyme [Cellulomonas humilata]
MADVLEVLPPRWREHRMILGDRVRWDAVEVLGDDDGVVLLIGGPRPSVLGLGDPATADRLVAGTDLGPARWMSVPRGCRPRPETLSRLDLVPFSTWDWLSTDAEPPHVAGEENVRRLDPVADADAIRACLREANPETSADPAGPDELGWWGVHRDGVLSGVIGAAARGAVGDGRSWHVHGLGVLPTLRRTGAGTALTAALTRAAFSGGASWVSLGMYAQNDDARRIYRRLGFRTDAEMTSFSPAGAARPPA